ncbi:MAG TPA: CHAD domain-containing protein [Bryobacteraceae bacterium]|jgi:CHAD domain-containing protein
MRDYARLQTAILLRRFAFQVNRAARFGDSDSIHDLRVSIRRLSRCLRVFSQFYPNRSWKKIRAQLGELMDTAAKVRDRDIALELLTAARIPRNAPVVTRLQAERQRAALDLLLEIRRWKGRNFSQKWRSALEL